MSRIVGMPQITVYAHSPQVLAQMLAELFHVSALPSTGGAHTLTFEDHASLKVAQYEGTSPERATYNGCLITVNVTDKAGLSERLEQAGITVNHGPDGDRFTVVGGGGIVNFAAVQCD